MTLFIDSRGEFEAKPDGSVTHFWRDGGSFTEFPGRAATARMIALGEVDLTEEERGRLAREICSEATR